jgi:hypothetical protein
VSQSNTSGAQSSAGNGNATTQNASQNAGGAEAAHAPEARTECGCDGGGSSSPAVQGIGQESDSSQSANSAAESDQSNPTNNAIFVAILSPGATSGPVSQSNSSAAQSSAGNTNGTTQNAAQNAGGWGDPVQAIGQLATNDQAASSMSQSLQACAANLALALPILSPGASSGPVSQSNTSGAQSSAGNTNGTTQNAAQAFSGWPLVMTI